MTRLEKGLTAVVAVLVLGGAGFTAGRMTGTTSAAAQTAPSAPASSPREQPSPSPSPSLGSSMSMGSAAGYTDNTLATQIARQAGMALAGDSPAYVTEAQARALGNTLPAGAHVNRQANTITFSSRIVSFTVIAVPPGGPDMTFHIGGLVNPTLVIPHDASVQVQFINADPDEAHGWQITSAEPPFEFDPGPVAIVGASARPLGDPSPAGDGAETITFQAGKPGSYHYVCPMPGHAQMGMNGALDIR